MAFKETHGWCQEKKFINGGKKMAICYITSQIQWDSFIDNSPHGLLYHKWDFLKLTEKYTGYELLPYGIYKGERLLCVFPLFYKRIAGVKLLFSPPPQAGIPYLGPVVEKDFESMKQDKKESYLNLIVQEIDNEINKIAPNYFSVVLVPGFLDIRPFQWLNYQVNPKYTYMINLKPELKGIWEGFSSLCRHNIRKGEDLKCRLVKCDDSSILTDLLTERYNEQGLNHAVDPVFLNEAINTYPKNLILDCLYDNDEIIGSTLNQAYNRYLGWMGLPKSQDSKYKNVNEFMIWQLIQEAKSLGFEKFEISGANKQSLCSYRSKFNPQLELYFIISKKDILGKLAETFYLNFVKKKLSIAHRE
jgi:hypothetical protein